jgi:hypothetical protein
MTTRQDHKVRQSRNTVIGKCQYSIYSPPFDVMAKPFFLFY